MYNDTYLALMELQANRPISNEEIIKDMIAQDESSQYKLDMWYGEEYYKSRNIGIINRWQEKENNKDSSLYNRGIKNHKVENGYLKKLIDQKVNYSLGKKVIIENADKCIEILDIQKYLKKIGKETSKKGVEWGHVYIDLEGKLRYTNIDGREVIPIWDTAHENDLQMLIRYYSVQIINDDKKISRYKVELWDKEKVSYYEQDVEGNFNLDMSYEVNPCYHASYNTFELDNIVNVEGLQWGKVPFIPLWNNDDHASDLEQIKAHIDLYDIVLSDFANDIDQFRHAIMTVKNNSASSYEEFMRVLKEYGIVEIDEDGEVGFLNNDIPTQARTTLLELLEKNIYEFGMGVDVKKIAGGQLTNVAIKSQYADLDLKANDFEQQIQEFIIELFYFVNKYLEFTVQKQDDLDKVDITFNRSIIFNELENADIITKLKGIISDRTLLSKSAWVDDVDEEMKEIELQNNALEIDMQDNNIDNEDMINERQQDNQI